MFKFIFVNLFSELDDCENQEQFILHSKEKDVIILRFESLKLMIFLLTIFWRVYLERVCL